MYQNVIFDLYGTLADIRTNEDAPYLWRKMSDIYSALGALYSARELKLEYKRLVAVAVEQAAEKLSQGNTWKRMYGDGTSRVAKTQAEPDITEVFAQLFRKKGISCDRTQARFIAITFRVLSRMRLELYDGVIELLEQLRKDGKGVYLLSNAQSDFTRPELDKLGLIPYFDGILISSEEGVKKPSPLFFHQLLDRYHLDASECIMIGNDEYSDIAGAKAVGMDCLYIHTDISPEVSGTVDANYVIMDGDFRKIESLISKTRE